MAIEAPAFEDTVDTEAPVLVPAFDDTTEAEAPIAAPAFEDTTEVTEQAPTQPRSAPNTFGDKASRVMAGSAEMGTAMLGGAVRKLTMDFPQLASLADEVAKATGALTTQEFMDAMQGAGESAETDYGANPQQSGNFLSTVAKGAGSLIPTLASGPFAPYTSMLGMGELGYRDAESKGATEEQKKAAFTLNSAVGLVTEKLLGLPAILKSASASKVPQKTLQNLVKTVTKEMGKGFAREGSQETLEQVSQDTIASYIAAYDPDRKVFDPKKLATTFLAGGIIGAPLAGTLSLVANSEPEQIAPTEQVRQADQIVDSAIEEVATAEIPTDLPQVQQIETAPVTEPATEEGAPIVETPETVETTPAPIQEEAAVTEPETAPEATPAPTEPTSIKNAQADIERETRGLPPAMETARRTQPQVWDEMQRAIESDDKFQDRLIRRLSTDPRSTVTDLEVMALLHAKIGAENTYDEANKAVNAATDEKTLLEATQEKQEAEAKLVEIYDLAKRVGSEQGRSLAARKMMVNRDYSVPALKAELQADQRGEKLTPQQEKLTEEISENIQRTDAEISARTDQFQAEQSDKAYADAFKEMSGQTPGIDSRIMEIARKIVSKLDSEADKARKRIRERMSYANAGADPTVLYDLAVIGSSKLAHGIIDFKSWSESMVKEFGDWIQPYLQNAYDQANARIDRLEETVDSKDRAKVKKAVRSDADEANRIKGNIESRAKEGESLNDLRAQVQRLALSIVRSGVNTREGLLDAVQGVLEPIQPGITPREVMDLISGYGDMRALDMEKAKVELRDLKGQFQQLSKLEDIQGGERPKKTGIERRTPSTEERSLIRQVNEAREKFGVGTLDAYKSRLQNQIADLQIRIDRGDFSKKSKKPLDISRDAEAVRLLAENERWKKKFLEARREARKKAETKLQRGIRYGKEVLNLPRSLLSSFDFSAVLRQSGFVTLGNPGRALKNIPSMLKSAFSQKEFEQSEAEIRNRPNANLYKTAKLYLADLEGELNSREEAFRSELSDKIPLVKGSNRAYIGFLNRMRADTFDSLTGNLGFTPTAEQLKSIAHYVNVATGRGDLGAHGMAAETLSTILWSPRLLVSRIQLLAGEPLARGDAKGVRKVIAKEYAKAVMGGAVIIGLGLLAGADIEDDPRSSDFGKLKFGNTRVDPWMGLQQISVLASRLATQETKTAGGNVVSLRAKEGEKQPFGSQDSADVIGRFVRSKLTPLLGEGINVLSGNTVVGEPVTPESTAKRALIPLSLQDVYDVMVDNGVPKGTAFTLLNLFGASVQHHQERR